MAWTQSDLDAIEDVLKTGELSVRLPTGRFIQFQSADEMMRLRNAMKNEIASLSRTRRGPRYVTATFCDDC